MHGEEAAPVPSKSRPPDSEILESIRQMRMAALYPKRADLEAWIIAAKELLEQLDVGPEWDMGVGYIDGMISLFNRRFGDEAPLIPHYRPPFADVPFPGADEAPAKWLNAGPWV